MGKRKAGSADERPPAQAQAQAAQPRRAPILVASRRRELMQQRMLGELNKTFATYVLANRDEVDTLEDACKDYIRYCAEIVPAAAAQGGAAEPAQRGGAVYVVGSGDNGQLGLGEELVECSRPRLLPAFGDLAVTAVACGGMHTLALTEDGKVWSWGVNDEGALGRVVRGRGCVAQPSRRSRALLSAQLPADADAAGVTNQTGWTPERIAFPDDAGKVCALSGGDSHSAALTLDGCVYAWGSFRDKSGCFGAHWRRGRTALALSEARFRRLCAGRENAGHACACVQARLRWRARHRAAVRCRPRLDAVSRRHRALFWLRGEGTAGTHRGSSGGGPDGRRRAGFRERCAHAPHHNAGACSWPVASGVHRGGACA